MIVFPRRKGQHKKSDSTKEEVEEHEKDHSKRTRKTHSVLPIVDDARANAISEVKRSEMPKGEEDAYKKMRTARSDARLVGVREKRAKAKADETAAAKK